MKKMLVSVALCTYNGEKYIYEQLRSILEQIQAVDEIVVCDDCSSDSTIDLIEGINTRYGDRIKILRNNSNLGAINSFERCISHCSGDIIFLSDQDDIWMPNKVQKIKEAFLSDSKSLAIFSDGILIDDKNNRLGSTLWEKWGFTSELQNKWRNNDFVFSELVFNRNVITGATLAFKKELVSDILPFEFPFGFWHDAWIGLMASGRSGLRFIDEPTILYRIHQQQQVGVSSGAGDKKFSPISWGQYISKLLRVFPEKRKFIQPEMAFPQQVKNFVRAFIRKVAGRK